MSSSSTTPNALSNRVKHFTLAQAKANKSLRLGDEIVISDRGNSAWKIVLKTSVVLDIHSKIGCDGASIYALSLNLNSQMESACFGATGGDDTAALGAACVALNGVGISNLKLTHNAVTLTADVDCLGLKIIGCNTVLPNAFKLLNHGGLVDCIISDVNTSALAIHPAPSVKFEKSKLLHKFSTNEYRAYFAANNGLGLVETTFRDNIVDGNLSNSIGGAATAFRITRNKNVNSLLMMQATLSGSNLLGTSFTRTFGGGTGGELITYQRADPVSGYLEYDVGLSPIDTLSIAAIGTTGGARTVTATAQPSGLVLGVFSLETAVETQMNIRIPVQNLTGTVRLTNTDATRSLTVAGVNAWLLGEENTQGDIDTIAYSYNVDDYTVNQGANDYALARFGDVTGGSYHGGETIITDSFIIDGVTETLTVGGLQYGKHIRHTSNVNVVWGDAAYANVVRSEYVADGMIRQLKAIDGRGLVYESVWTMMCETSADLTNTRIAVRAGDGVGAAPLHETYERTNAIQQDKGLVTGVINYFTVFNNECNSNGGVYVIANGPTSRKAYYGPVLFNKKVVNKVNAEQITVFGL